jgi:PTS system fructose-specific IIC component
VFFEIGHTAFSMLVPIFAGFIAFAIADRPAMAGIMPVVVIPLASCLIVVFVMITAIGSPVSSAQSSLTNWLNGMSATNDIVLGLPLGAMMAFDMGGPVNKSADTFGLVALASGNLRIMAAVMAAAMTRRWPCRSRPSYARGCSRPPSARRARPAWLLGLSFIIEGAIPFAAADPLRVTPSLMGGSAVTGALSMAFGATSRAPHGGLRVIGLIGRPGPLPGRGRRRRRGRSCRK